MAAGLVKLRSDGRIHVRSAGSAPGERINPAVIDAMAELGVDMSQEFPKPLTDEVVAAADAVITMGCGDACPIYPGKRYEDWELQDPAGESLETVRGIRDDLDVRVQKLIGELLPERRVEPAPIRAVAGRRGDRDVRARLRRLRRDHGRPEDRCARPHRRRDHLRPGDHGHDLRRRPHLGRPLNPAVTASFALTRHFPRLHILPYWAAQLAGALLAAAILRGSLGNIAHVGATYPTGSDAQAFLWEAVLSFFLMFVIMAVATDTSAVGEAAAIAIGGTVGLDAMFGGPITGASMNPARSLGPAIVTGDLHAVWIYLLAPIAGAAVAALTYTFIRGESRT